MKMIKGIITTTLAMTIGFAGLAQATNQISGDYNGDLNQDAFNQAINPGETSSLTPLAGNSIASFHKSWTTTHPNITTIKDWSADKYGAYSANLNSNPGDELLLLGKRKIILIHGDIITPIVLKPEVDNAVISWNSSDVASAQEFIFDGNPDDFKVQFGDFNGDGYAEIVMQGNNLHSDTFILNSDGSVRQTLSDGYLGIDWSVAAHGFVISDLNGDGIADITLNPVGGGFTILAYTSSSGNVYMVDGGTNPEAPPSIQLKAIPSENAESTTIGSLPDSLNIASSGAATYRVDIQAPNGVNGMNPNISLSYNSQSGLGLLGVGWNMIGLSSISRCNKTLETDGYVRGVKLDTEDAICLDGERLINVSGSPWANSAEYRTEIESSKRVTYTDNASGKSFYVELPGGEKLEYGTSVDSKLTAVNQNVIYKWMLTKRIDSFGNEIIYNYSGTDQTGKRISYINYSGYRTVFNYATRPDARFKYLLGNRIENDQRLTDIKVFNRNNIQINHYNINYKLSSFSQRSLVDNIQKCVSENNTCLTPTSYNYSEPRIGLSTVKLNLNRSRAGLKLVSVSPADINGDGKPELVLVYAAPSNDWKTTALIEVQQYQNQTLTPLYQFNAVADVRTYGATTIYQPLMLIADADGNGTDDIIFGTSCTSTSDCTWKINYFDENSTIVHSQSYNWELRTRAWTFTDMDSDGRLDLFTGFGFYKNNGSQATNFNAYQEIMATNTESSELYSELVLKGIGAGNFQEIAADGFWNLRDGFQRPVDINGDGQPDLIRSYFFTECTLDDQRDDCGGSGYGGSWFETADGLFSFSKYAFNTRLVSASYLRPYILEQSQNSQWSWTPPNALDIDIDPLIAQGDEGASVLPICTSNADFNGDGLIDFFADNRFFIADGFGLKPEYFNGEGTSCDQREKEAAFWQALDINGDGLADEVYSTGTEVYARLNTGDGFSATPILMFNTDINDINKDQILWIDLDGDGLIGAVHLDKEAGRIIIREDIEDQFVGKDVMIEVVDGFNAKSTIEYKPLTDSSVYTKGSGAEQFNWGDGSGVFDIISSTQVVSELNKENVYTENGTLESLTRQYQYEGLRLQYGGRGFLGYQKFTELDVNTGITTETTFRQDYPFNGQISSVKRIKNGKPFYQKTNQNFYNVSLNGGKNQFVAVSDSLEVTSQFDVVNNVLSTNTKTAVTKATSSNFEIVNDSYVNVSSNSLTLSDGFSTDERTVTTTFDYLQENTTDWLIKRPTNTTQVFSRQGKTSITNSQAVRYAANAGYVDYTEVEPLGDESIYLKTAFEYDTFGNVINTVVCSSHFKTNCNSSYSPGDLTDDNQKVFRVASSVFDSSGLHLTEVSNQEFMVNSFSQFDNWDRPIQVTDAVGVVTDLRYDNHGKFYFQRDNTGGFNLITYSNCAADCPANSSYKVDTEAAGNVKSTAYFDFKGREIKNSAFTFNDSYSHTETFYDVLGRAVKASEPYFENGNKHYAHMTYDLFGRETISVSASGVTTKNDYVSGQEIRKISGNFAGVLTNWSTTLNQTITKTNNGFGELLSIRDSLNNPITYNYDAKGSATNVTGVDSAVITNTYDVLGRRLSINDPDKGLWQTSYNALGETIRTIAPDGITTLAYFDAAGRQLDRVVKTNSSNTATTLETSASSYVGALVNQESISTGSQTAYIYDAYGRPSDKIVSIDGYNFTSQYTYDQFGRLFQKFDASGGHRGLAYNYKNGVVDRIYETQGSSTQSTTEYFKLLAVDARGNATSSRQGNGVDTLKLYDEASGFLKTISTGNGMNIQAMSYEFDGLGNLRSRRDQNQQILSQTLNETFEYDTLNRVTRSLINDSQILAMSYFDNGNIQTKSNVSGTYSYGNASANCNNNFAGPHAVTAIGTKNYCYDARGNQTHAYTSGSLNRQIQYGYIDKPVSISSNSETTNFVYDASNNRIKRTDTKSGNTDTTYYADGVEYFVTDSGATHYKRYLDGYAIHDVGDATDKISYVHTDHLGSMDVYTDASGSVTERMSFATFGKRRNSLGWSGSLTEGALQSINDISKRGFTGHEQIDHAGIIHMNGRIYDSDIGRFVQADPVIQEVKNSQNYNRYSYVLNNPLSYTDPTGYEFWPTNPGFDFYESDQQNRIATALKKAAKIEAESGTDKLESSEGSGTSQNTDDQFSGPRLVLRAPTADELANIAATQRAKALASLNETLDNAQDVLDGLGLVPGLGEVADIANAGISLMRGDYVGAALSMGAAIPFVGNIIGPLKMARKVDPKSLISRQTKNEMSSNQVKRLRRNMRENGFDMNKPIEAADVNGKLIILDGHHRVKGAIGAGIKEVPVNINQVTREQGDQLLREAAEAMQ